MKLPFALVSALLIFGSIVGQKALAQTEASQPSPEMLRYQRATDGLSKGRNLKKVIADCSLLVKQHPDSAQYHALLGCAYASRFASLSCGMADANLSYVADKTYQRRLDIWQQMQGNPAMPLFGIPKPAAPSAPETPDDKQPYDTSGRIVPKDAKPREVTKAMVTPAEKETQILAGLAQNALRSFTQARQLSSSLPLERRTQIASHCGWGLLLLYRYGKDLVPFAPASQTEKQDKSEKPQDPNELLVLRQEEIIACFEECTQFEPKKAEHWQGLAFAYVPDYLRNVFHSSEVEKIAKSAVNQVGKALPYLRRALKLKRDKELILYQIALVSTLERPKEAAECLQKLADGDKQAAAYSYQSAVAEVKQMETLKGDDAMQQLSKAITAVQAGNRATSWQNIPIVLPISRWVAGAWAYRPLYGIGHDSYWAGELSGWLNGVAREKLDEQPDEMLMTLGTALMDFGLNSLKHYRGDDLDADATQNQVPLYYRALDGYLCCAKAHKCIQAAAKMMPTEPHLALAERYAQVENYWKAWDAVVLR